MFNTALDVDIRPGSGLGIFELGSSLWTVMDTLRRMQHVFPQVEVKYDPDSAITSPIILHIRSHMDLLFSGEHQRLTQICLRRLRDHPPLVLRYKDQILSNDEHVLRRINVSRALGPTYPGDDLRYPGLWFSFEEDGIGEGLKGAKHISHAEDKAQEVKRVLISQKSSEDEDRDALEEVLECPIMNGEISRAVIKVHDGISIYFHPTGTPCTKISIARTTAQDLTVALGPPLRVHYKEDNRMKIHSKSHHLKDSSETGYFYNYFQHGLDFLISGTTHMVEKIIVHTNVPGTPLFQRYKRCPWEVEGRPEDDEDDTPPRKRFYDRFETISHFLSPREPPPSMLLDRTDEEDGVTLPSPTTRLHGYDGVILEVTESSQVVSVMLF